MLAFLFRLLALSAALGVAVGQSQLELTFTQQTAAAPFTPRWWPSVESYPKAITYPGGTLPANSLIMFGGSTNLGQGEQHLNDVWGSSDNGRTWVQIANNAFAASRFPGYTIDGQARLFKVAGSDRNDVWMSTNAVTWTQQAASAQFPGRTFPDLQVDSKNVLYLIGGSGPSTNPAQSGMNDVWKSTNQGVSWTQATSMPFPSPPGRSTGFLIHHVSKQTKLDILTYMGGYSRVGTNGSTVQYHNDVYMSSDGGAKWLQVTAAAPWSKRDNFNAEVTRDGAIVVVAGFNDLGGDLNDVWVSMDGGYTWGQCVKESQWTDRRWLSTALDSAGYLLVVAGDERNNNTGPRIPRNDVWRSTFSLNDNPALARACGVEVPACGVGLTCVPGDNTRIENGKVTCPAVQSCSSDNLAFNVLTAHAPWPARHSPGVEFLKKRVTVGGVNYNAGNSLVLYGGTGPGEALLNDVWLSSNGGLDWAHVPSTSFFTGSAWSGHIIDSANRIYKIGGERWGSPNTGNNEVWMSSNGGVTWVQQKPSRESSALPPRSFPDVYVDGSDYLYVAGGLEVGGPGLNDVWQSTDQGKNWKRQGGIPFGSPPGRSSASLLHHRSPVLNKDIMYYFGGYSRGGGQGPVWHNDVWASSDLGKSWRQVTAQAPWSARNNFNAEITKDGLIVFAGGYFNNQQALNDVWISADGGYTWGQCVAEAAFTDRRWHATAMDNAGYLYILGGEEVEHGQYVKTNDVWKSSYAFTNANRAKLQRACGLTFPSPCTSTLGLSCWPGTSTKFDSKGQVTCSALTTFRENDCQNPDAASSGDSEWDVSTGGDVKVDGGLSIGMIALIVVLVLAGVAALGGYYFYRRKQQSSQDVIPGVGSDGLLGTAHVSSDSTAEGASSSDYYAQTSSTNTA